MESDDFDREFEQHCRALDLEWPFDLETLRLAKRDQAQVWHPDKHQSNERLRVRADEKLKRVNLAYDALRQFLVAGPTLCRKCRKPRSQTVALCISCTREEDNAKELDAVRRRATAAESKVEAARIAAEGAARARASAEASAARAAQNEAALRERAAGQATRVDPSPPRTEVPASPALDPTGTWIVNDGLSVITFTPAVGGHTFVELNPLGMLVSTGTAILYADGVQLIGHMVTGLTYQLPLRFDGQALSGQFARQGLFGVEYVPIVLRRAR